MLSVLKLTVRPIVFNKNLRYCCSRFQIRCISDGVRDDKKGFNPFKKKSIFKNGFEDDSKIASRICITVLGNGAFGEPRCIGIFTEFKGFLFNCGEGVGRLCQEYEVDTFLIRNIFVTQNIWRNVSGLADIYLGNDAFGVHKMNIYGPPGVEYFMDVLTSYKKTRLSKKSEYADENMEIRSIPIKSSNPHFKGKADTCYSYVCKIFKKIGDFNVEKCVDLGVPIGPHLLQLKNGEDVVLPSGRIIHSADVLDASCPDITILIVDCPSEEFLDSFVNEKQFVLYQSLSDVVDQITYVFHFSPPDIIKSRKYQAWIQRFHKNVQHYILNSSNPSMSSEAIHQTQNLLHLFHPEIFKLLPEERTKPLSLKVSSKIMYPPPMLQVYLRPERKLSWDNVLKNDSEESIKALTEIPDFSNELSKLKSLIFMRKPVRGNEYPEVLFLGTSSATSTACRNVSAILVKLNSDNSILLDCGEGTFRQLVRYFGESEVARVLQKISCIFITHKHTDHYMGLFEMIKARIEAFENAGVLYQRMALILPPEVRSMFNRFCEMYEPLSSKVRIFPCKNLVSENENHLKLSPFLKGIKLLTVPVNHCENAYGIVLQQGSEWKIVYSGDTLPCQKLVEAGKDCTLLIHEASVEDNLLSEALQKKHSTPSQVIDIAEKMNAQNTIMTHFSKRYLEVPMFKECDNRNVGCSFDFMKVRLHDLPILPLFLPALKCLYQEKLEEFLMKSSTIASSENVFLRTWRAVKRN
ncbi:Zinc phosphodiesterase ELAC protein 2 [Araneus ventricosus]|uniref:ribonuclease Z n=1 Tax=Araneus ventricosus TaxID=182803 RepID=A0A4Y2QB05_ARAVE|nr:Zinc phosphodiesterase ELAC protein 2 [Araneus ventricosus]